MGWLLYNGGYNQWFPAATPCRSNQIAVHLSDELKGYLLGAHRFTLAMIRATAEVFVHHRHHHAESSLVALGLTLRKGVEVGNFGRSEKHGSCIRAGRDTCSTADACSRVKRSIRSFF
jgi:hypothetical protein